MRTNHPQTTLWRLSILLATMMWTSRVIVNAEQLVFTEQISPEQAARAKALKGLIDALMANGKSDKLAKSVGPGLGLEEQAPIRYFGLKPNRPHWEKKFCDLVFVRDADGHPKAPHCLAILLKKQAGSEVTFTDFRFDLTGRLIAGVITKAKNDERGKPVHGSAVDSPIDVNDKVTREDAEKELQFWLSGNYRKHLKSDTAKVDAPKTP